MQNSDVVALRAEIRDKLGEAIAWVSLEVVNAQITGKTFDDKAVLEMVETKTDQLLQLLTSHTNKEVVRFTDKLRKNLDDLYWSYVTEYCAKQDPYRPDSPFAKTDYLKRNMPYASFSGVGIHKLLARADQHAKERIAKLGTI